MYYNRTQSEVLRERNRIQLILGFNQWELQAEQVGWVLPLRVCVFRGGCGHRGRVS